MSRSIKWGHWLLRFLLVSAVVQFAFAVYYIIHVSAIDMTPPITNMRLVTLNSPVAAGQELQLRVYRTKWRDDCPLLSTRLATDLWTGDDYALPSKVWNGGSSMEQHVDLLIDTAALPPSIYVGKVQAIYACPRFTYPVEGEFYFTVREAGNDKE
jgi:hypothetical protein